ncbi:unnamed protein product, partial [marine sediment metagenome]
VLLLKLTFDSYWKENNNTITTLNQQNREYLSLHFAEAQKELSGMKVELGSSC